MAGFDAYVIGDALAACFRSGTLTPPSGYPAVRESKVALPNNVPLSPSVMVTLPNGEIVIGGGSQQEATLEYHVHFIYAKHSGDVARDVTAMLKWLGVLLPAPLTSSSLGLSGSQPVKSAFPIAFEEEVYTVGGQEWYGWDITYSVMLRDIGWTIA